MSGLRRIWGAIAMATVALGVACSTTGGGGSNDLALASGDLRPAYDNVKECTALAPILKCGEVDLTASFICSNYASATCNLVSFFDCVKSHLVCVNNTFDSDKLASAPSCNSLANCGP